MSFIHFLTIGHLDHEHLSRGQARARRPLAPEMRAAILSYADARSVRESDGHVQLSIEGASAAIVDDVARLPWYEPRLNRSSVAIALLALDQGYVVADVEHARRVPREELEAAATGTFAK